jgi:hypothetical protein
MKKLLLILLCLPLLFSCGNNKERQIINLKSENEILKNKLEKEQVKRIKDKVLDIIKQFNITNNYEIKLEEFDSNPCTLIDSIEIIVQNFYKIALNNNYNVILENEKEFDEIAENFFKIFPILTKHYNSPYILNDDFECKELGKSIDKLMENERFEEWCVLQGCVLFLNILDKSNLYIPSYKINLNDPKKID